MREWDDSIVKPPKGEGKTVLYLDFDGVLHHESVYWHPMRGPFIKTNSSGWGQSAYVLFQHAGLLSEILAPYPDLKIVLSTSWVRSYGCYGAAKYPPQPLRDRVIGATFHSRMREDLFVAAPRGMQVWGDVVKRKPGAWLALDDDYLHWPKWCLENYVRSDEVLGISAPAVLTLIQHRLDSLCHSKR